MSTARALRAEREYLKVVRDDVVAAVNALDKKIDAHDPTCSPLQVGEIRHFDDQYRVGRHGYAVTLLGNEDIIVIVPLRAHGSAVMDAVSNLVDVVVRELDPARPDD